MRMNGRAAGRLNAVVVLKAPKLEGDKLTFEVSVLEGGLSKATGPASLLASRATSSSTSF